MDILDQYRNYIHKILLELAFHPPYALQSIYYRKSQTRFSPHNG